MDYKLLARDILDLADSVKSMNNVPARKYLFRWRGQIYFGQIQIPFDDQPEIAALSVSRQVFPEGLAEAIQELRPGISYLDIPDRIATSSRYLILRLKDTTLSNLTVEQKNHLRTHPVFFLDAETIH